MTDKLHCPFCGAELKIEMAGDIETGRLVCCTKNCPVIDQNLFPDVWELLTAGKKAQDALKVANKAIDCAERFLLGVQDKKIEMQKATASSHLLLFQMPAMAALCLNTINDYKNEITSITKQEE